MIEPSVELIQHLNPISISPFFPDFEPKLQRVLCI